MSPNVTDSPEDRVDVHNNARLTPARSGVARIQPYRPDRKTEAFALSVEPAR
jgi:hypothetical protein